MKGVDRRGYQEVDEREKCGEIDAAAAVGSTQGKVVGKGFEQGLNGKIGDG